MFVRIVFLLKANNSEIRTYQCITFDPREPMDQAMDDKVVLKEKYIGIQYNYSLLVVYKIMIIYFSNFNDTNTNMLYIICTISDKCALLKNISKYKILFLQMLLL